MILDWHDLSASQLAFTNYQGSLQTETDTLRELLNQFMSTGLEKYEEGFCSGAEDYVARSLTALGCDWEQLCQKLREAARLVEVFHSDRANDITNAIRHEEGNSANRAAILVLFVWPMVLETIESARKEAERQKMTFEKYAALSLAERSRLFAVEKKSRAAS